MSARFTRLSVQSVLPSILALSFLTVSLHSAPQTVRTWTNKDGRSVTAAFVEVSGGQVMIQLANGTRSQVALDMLSLADQEYVKSLSASIATSQTPSVTGPLTWPSGILAVDPKSINVVEGLQDPKTSRYHYSAGNFEFISTAPLAKSVMAEVASDFLLTEKFFMAQPWGWQSRPAKGDRHIVYMAADDADYLTLGGRENNASEMVNEDCLIRFRALGLKRVGARYQYDSREKEAGQITAIVSFALLSNASRWLQGWASLGLSNFLRYVAYQNNGTVRFSELELPLRKAIKERLEVAQVSPDLKRMLKYMRPSREARPTDLRSRLEQQLDGFLLIYYFGFLDGDGSGAALHQYYRSIFARSQGAQASAEAVAMLKAEGLEKATPDEMLARLFNGRTDEALAAEMTEKFKPFGVRF